MAENIGPMLEQMLTRYGLGSLAPWLSQRITAGADASQIELELYDRPEFITRFPAIRIRGREGMVPLSVDEYLAYERQMSQISQSFGLTITKDQTDDWLANDKSAAEMETRMGMAAQAVYMTDPATRADMRERFNIQDGDLVAYWLNPKVALPIMQRRFVSSQIAGSAINAGYDEELTNTQLGYLYDRGLTGETATEAFGELSAMDELFEAVDETEDDIGVDEQLGSIVGDQDTQEKIARRGEKRAAKFQEGGGFSTGQTGIAGLGSAATQ